MSSEPNEKLEPAIPQCVSRRDFLIFAGASTVSVAALGLTGLGPSTAYAQLKEYPRRLVGTISSLRDHTPITFQYPYDDTLCLTQLVKLGVPAGGGVGEGSDIVAFNQMCTHQGGIMLGRYESEYRVLGPCPIHLTTFDLTRHGIVVSGHATQGLPQVLLEVDGDDIYATGVMGLLYGFSNNKTIG